MTVFSCIVTFSMEVELLTHSFPLSNAAKEEQRNLLGEAGFVLRRLSL